MKRLKGLPVGPSWFEVIFGAMLSVALGGVLGLGLLAFGPVNVVKELPPEADREAQATYFVEGSRDTVKARAATAKRKSFLEGQSVSLIEDELNVLAGPPVSFGTPRPVAAKPGAAPAAKASAPVPAPKPGAPKSATAAEVETFVAGTPNFRVQENSVQIGVPVTVNALGLGQKIVVQARGTIVKRGEIFGFEPETIYVGACPLHRVPYLFGYVREKLLEQKIPDDIAAAWAKVASVTIEGNTLRLKMP